MKKTFVTGLLAVGLIAAGGTGFYMTSASAKADGGKMMQSQGMRKLMGGMMNTASADEKQGSMCDKKMNTGEMQKMMKNGKMDFESMKPYMKKMHPDLSDKQLEELFKSMQEKGCPGNMKDQSKKMDSL
ncbi:MAG: hypothetical protein Q8906_01810 [Bacillota bacterium]|nr:hypothetical protein [Bacillota bacterium]